MHDLRVAGMARCEIEGDSMQPRGDVVRGPSGPDLAVEPNERVVGQILREASIVRDPRQVTDERRAMLLVRRLDGEISG